MLLLLLLLLLLLGALRQCDCNGSLQRRHKAIVNASRLGQEGLVGGILMGPLLAYRGNFAQPGLLLVGSRGGGGGGEEVL